MSELQKYKEQLQVEVEWLDLVSQEEASKKFGISINTLTKWRYAGKIKVWMQINGRNPMLSKKELLELLKNPS